MSPAGQGRVLRTVEVGLGERSYPVQIGNGTLGGLGGEIQRRSGARRAVMLTVPAVGRRYAGRLLRSLRAAGLCCRRIDVADGDASKNLRQVAKLYEALLDFGADRHTVLVALGGGMIGEVWQARTAGGIDVALKICPLSVKAGLKELKALQLVKQVRHANLVEIHAFWLVDEDGNILSESEATAARATSWRSPSTPARSAWP